MDRDTFWSIIEDARTSVDDVYEVASAVRKRLGGLDPVEIVAFKQHQDDLEAESYRWDLWAVAYIIHGGCSDDGFDYFRAWLLANGRQRYEAAMIRPVSIGVWAEGEGDYEDMLYVAVEAYQMKTGDDFPFDTITSQRPADPIGEEWEEDQLATLYPELYKKFS